MSERAIAEILGWKQCVIAGTDEALHQPPGETFYTDATPAVDDMLAWLRERDYDVYVNALFVSLGDREHGVEYYPISVEVVPDEPTDHQRQHEADTLLEALTAAVRSVDEALR